MRTNTLREDDVSARDMVALEEELIHAKEQYGVQEKPSLFVRFGDWIASQTTKREQMGLNKKKYIKLALIGGWLCGAHRFYARQYVRGVLYLLFFWTGLAFIMTFIDLMIVIPIKPDENGMIYM